MGPQREAGTADRARASLGEASWRRHAVPGPFLRTTPAAKNGALAAAILERNTRLTRRLERLRARPDNGAMAAVGAGWALRRYRRGGDDVGSAEEAAFHGPVQQGADAHGAVVHDAAGHDTVAHDTGAHGTVARGAAALGTGGYDAAAHATGAHGAAVHGTVAYGTATHGTAAHGAAAHDIPSPAAVMLPADKPASLGPTDPGGCHAVDIEGQGHVPRSASPPLHATAPAGPGTRAVLPGLYGNVPGAGAFVPARVPAFHAADAAPAIRPAASHPTPAARAPLGAAAGAAAATYASAAPFDFPLVGRAVSARWGAPPSGGQEANGRLSAGPAWNATLSGLGLRQSTPRAATAADPGASLPASYRSLPPAGVVTAVAVAASPSGNKAAAQQESLGPAPSAIQASGAMGAGVAAGANPGALQPLGGRSADRAGGRVAASLQTAGLANLVGMPPTSLDASAASKRLPLATPLDSVDRPWHLPAVRRLQALRGQPGVHSQLGVHSQAAGSIPQPLAVHAGLAPLQRFAEARWPAIAPLTTAARGAIVGSHSQEHAGGRHAMRVPGQRAGRAGLSYAYGPGAGTAAVGSAPCAAAATWGDGGSAWTGPGPGGQGGAPVLPTAIPAALSGEIPSALSGEIPAAIPPAIPAGPPDAIPGAMPSVIPDAIPGAATRAPGHVPGRRSVPRLDVNDNAGPPEQPVIGGEAVSALPRRSRIVLTQTSLPGARRRIAAAPRLSVTHPARGSNGPARPAAASGGGHALPLPLAAMSRPAWPFDAPALAPAHAAAGTTGAQRVQPLPPAPPAWPGDTHPGPAAHASGGWTGAASVTASHGVVPVSSEAAAAGQGLSRLRGAIEAELDLEQLSEHIWQSIMDKLVVEQERRGTGKWP